MPSMITPPGGWSFESKAGSSLPQNRQEPVYAYDPALFYQHKASVINDLRSMGGREARQLTFGAAFGATSGFFLGRFVVTLLKLAVIAAIVLGVSVSMRLLRTTTPAPQTQAATDPSTTPPTTPATEPSTTPATTPTTTLRHHHASESIQDVDTREATCLLQGISPGMRAEEVKSRLGYAVVEYRGPQWDVQVYRVRTESCSGLIDFYSDGRVADVDIDNR